MKEKTDWDNGFIIDYSTIPVPTQTHGCIYSIKCPINNDIIYIGQSIDFKVRKWNHLSASAKTKNGKTHIGKYIISLKENGVKPIIEVVDLVPISDLNIFEDFYISLFKSWGFDLLNFNPSISN